MHRNAARSREVMIRYSSISEIESVLAHCSTIRELKNRLKSQYPNKPDKRYLDDPYEVVLTESYANRLLDEDESVESLINTTIELNGDWLSKITAIVKDSPIKSQLQFEVLVSYASYIDRWSEGAENSMDWSDFYHYLLIDENSDMEVLNKKIGGIWGSLF